MADRLGWTFCVHQCLFLALMNESSGPAGGKFHFMTGLWMGDWGLSITESIIITDLPPECPAIVERQLVVK